MIEFVQTPDGIVPKPQWDAMQRLKADQARKRLEAHEEVTERRAHARGIKMADVRALMASPLQALRRAAKAARAKFSKLEIEKAYPCRSCRVVVDEHYAAACAKFGALPCYVKKHMRGCEAWQPRPIKVGGRPSAPATPAASITRR